MRKNRLIFWMVSILVCAIIIVAYKIDENKIPDEEKAEYKVYCSEENFKEKVIEMFEETSIEKTHKIIFTDNKNEAELIFSDEILASDTGYEKMGWSPLVIAFDKSKDKVKFYKEEGYISEEDNVYTIQFDKIITATLKGEWNDKIYYPNLNTREGELFFDFLLININDGKYPTRDEEMQNCIEIANEFLDSSVLVQVDSTERLKNKKVAKDEMYVTFENDIYYITDNDCRYAISYPSSTVLHEWYWKSVGENANEIRQSATKIAFGASYSLLTEMADSNHIRCEELTWYCYRANYIESSGFSYVEIPLKEE